MAVRCAALRLAAMDCPGEVRAELIPNAALFSFRAIVFAAHLSPREWCYRRKKRDQFNAIKNEGGVQRTKGRGLSEEVPS